MNKVTRYYIFIHVILNSHFSHSCSFTLSDSNNIKQYTIWMVDAFFKSSLYIIYINYIHVLLTNTQVGIVTKANKIARYSNITH